MRVDNYKNGSDFWLKNKLLLLGKSIKWLMRGTIVLCCIQLFLLLRDKENYITSD